MAPQTGYKIMLLSTEVKNGKFTCKDFEFDKPLPKYYAISYRWGEHKKWEIETTKYKASITSVSTGNLAELCKLYSKKVEYIWIDGVCFSQSDEVDVHNGLIHMDEIYKRSARIIAVPDLGYCDDNPHPKMGDITAEHVKEAIKKITSGEKEILGHEFYMSYIIKVIESTEKFCRTDFVIAVVSEWVSRSWVVSERIVGQNNNKMDVIILRGNTPIDYEKWKVFLNKARWTITSNQADVIWTILNSDAKYFADRLIAILPHTKYYSKVKEIVDVKKTITSGTDLKMKLLEILDDEGKVLLLEGRYHLVDNATARAFPSFITNVEFDLYGHEYKDVKYFSTIKAEKISKEYALKIKGRFIELPSNTMVNPKTEVLLKSKVNNNLKNKRVVDIVLCKRSFEKNVEHVIMRCVGLKDTLVVDYVKTDDTGKHSTCDKYKEMDFVIY
ncbi:hypothetical protein DFQ28_007502 [Apophysomyces sp. BC1034]|nr:hypothetical protein DFQ30_000351 [Apophysomyces sp. BC1015]KAG0176135.1 hypothetical protein DFQ29_006520 [Apophysomyces sp. BC1021]KAG0186653.1 hypothetical protein DFQ28_007502 [Apophysomyces sp. BC1034]